MNRKPVGLDAPYRRPEFSFQDMLLDRIKVLEALVAKLEQRIAKLEGK